MTLRPIIKKHLEEETLRDFLKDKYSTTSEFEKRELLQLVEGEIERKINGIINSFLEDLKKGSPEARRERTSAFIFAALTLIATTGLAHAVNLKDLIYIGIMITILLIVQIIQIHNRW
jgi:hypothetical protein